MLEGDQSGWVLDNRSGSEEQADNGGLQLGKDKSVHLWDSKKEEELD